MTDPTNLRLDLSKLIGLQQERIDNLEDRANATNAAQLTLLSILCRHDTTLQEHMINSLSQIHDNSKKLNNHRYTEVVEQLLNYAKNPLQKPQDGPHPYLRVIPGGKKDNENDE